MRRGTSRSGTPTRRCWIRSAGSAAVSRAFENPCSGCRESGPGRKTRRATQKGRHGGWSDRRCHLESPRCIIAFCGPQIHCAMNPRCRFFPLSALTVFTMLALSAVAQTDAKQQDPKPRIGSTVFKWEDLKAKPTPNGERRDVANNPTPTLETFECHITTLNPGKESHAP